MMRSTFSAEKVRACLEYDPNVGSFTWKERPLYLFADSETRPAHFNMKRWNNRMAGKSAGTLSKQNGYLIISLFGFDYPAHILAFVIKTGEWPTLCVDHIDGDRSNNKFENLRLVTRQENSRNRRKPKGGSSRYMGVSWSKKLEKWIAQIEVNDKGKYLGSFNCEFAACVAYRNALRDNGFHQNHGL